LKGEIDAELKLHIVGTLELMDKALLLEEKNNASRKVRPMSWERKMGEKYMAIYNRGFTRWEKGGNRE